MKREIPQEIIIGIIVVLVLGIGGFFVWRLSGKQVDNTPPPAGFGDPNKRFSPSPPKGNGVQSNDDTMEFRAIPGRGD